MKRIFPLILCSLVTIAFVYALDTQLPSGSSKTPRLGFFLSPQKGFWQNAEAVNQRFNETLSFPQLQGAAEVYLDERLVPHVYAEKENDLYFIQGYLHARFRLWQMEFQTHAAAGRLSEIMGAKASGTDFLAIDRFFRRLGMVYAAENSLRALEADPGTKAAADAYTAGVNAYIESLSPDKYPFEYKLLAYAPEKWTNLKTALFLKYMSFDLAGFEEDFEMTAAKAAFTREQFEQLYPYGQDSLDPIVPRGTVFQQAGLVLRQPANADSAYFNFKSPTPAVENAPKPDPDNGSNNWAVHGSRTKSGRPILCNDPHLGLNLPSIWYEIQLSCPEFNAYGASFPGAPSVIIGFNDSTAFGFTNAMRDVRDYYELQFRDSTMREYWYNGSWQPTTFREERIRIKGQPDHVERIPMTVWGPVMYDRHHGERQPAGNKAYACRWKAHDPSNELRTFYLLNRAKNVKDYENAIGSFSTPGQNMIFASKGGDIAIRQQGEFPAKWRRQGDFIMPGGDSSYAWAGIIPATENVTLLNPPRGFVSSANQLPYDTSYPYYLGGSYPPYRGLIINRRLAAMQGITPADMQRLQTDNYNVFAEMARPLLLKYVLADQLTPKQQEWVTVLGNWNLMNNPAEAGASVFTAWWDSLEAVVFRDDIPLASRYPWPGESTLLEAILKDSTFAFIDNLQTSQRETLYDMVTLALQKASGPLAAAQQEGRLAWGRYKDSEIRHLLKIPSLGRLHLNAGGGVHIINAHKKTHGPSWRMIVHLTDQTEAYGIYPGGQSGNPGSPFYDNFISDWVAGKYYRLFNLPKQELKKQKLLGTLSFKKSKA